MARYWIYLNDEVSGPFAVEQLIRQRGFSRQTQVCVDDASGQPRNWMSPAEIPELAHIFKAVDDHMVLPPSSAPPRPVPKPKPAPVRPVRAYTPAVTLHPASRDSFSGWIWAAVFASLIGGGAFAWHHYTLKNAQAAERSTAQGLIENVRLPTSSLYSTPRHYLQEKEITPQWEFERLQEALYRVTLSWPGNGTPGSNLYTFEANTQAQTVRGINTAAKKLLAEGFPAPVSAKAKTPPPPKKSPAEQFPQVLEDRRSALESGNASAVWDLFSARKKSEMARGGISRDGFLRLQSLTHRVDSPLKQAVLKTKPMDDTEMLVLLKQTQAGRPDVFIKQLWVYQENAWKLDDEQQRAGTASASEAAAPAPAPAAAPSSSSLTSPKMPDVPTSFPTTATPSPEVPAKKPSPAALPGMSQ